MDQHPLETTDLHQVRLATRHLRLILHPSALILLLFVFVALAQAHGIGTPQLLNATTGPYLLSIWTDPDPLRADEAHVVVAVIDPATQEYIVSDVTVTVRLRSLAEPVREVSVAAGPDNTNRLLFAAEFNDRVTPGRWQVGVSAAGGRGSGEEVTFEVEIAPARGFNWLWLGAAGLVLALAVWLLSALRAAPKRPGAKAQRQAKKNAA